LGITSDIQLANNDAAFLKSDLDDELSLDMDLDLDLSLDDVTDEEKQLASDNDIDSLLDTDLSEMMALDTELGDESIQIEPEQAIDVIDEDSEQAASEQIRVRSELIDSIINQASESNTLGSHFGQHISGFKNNMDELGTTLERLKDQLRELDIETESQIVYRMEASGGEMSRDFDPLEFDRFTQLQTLSRSMLETLNDLVNIEGEFSKEINRSEKSFTQHNRLSRELQDNLLKTRMTGVQTIESRLRRIVEQTATELNKSIEFKIDGVELDVDGTILRKVTPPLEHILRNAVSHGIERAEIRQAKGKSMTGNIHLTFAHEGSELIVTISDDGAGLDTDSIREKAISLNIVPENSVISDEEAAQLIFESGLSTADKVSQISGRGVGMDVVNTEVKSVGGTLHIATKKGKGTTFTMHLPTKMSLLQVLVVKNADDFFAFPLAGLEGIESITQSRLDEMTSDEGKIIWYDEMYDFLELDDVLGKPKQIRDSSTKYPVLFTHFGNHRTAIRIEQYLGNREVVTKNIGPQLESVKGLMGGTILTDGHVALILDLATLIRTEHFKKHVTNAEYVAVSDNTKVLVVDDSITVRRISEKFLQKNHFDVMTAKDGIDALAVIEDQTPDIILLDIEMPRMNGYDLLQHIRNDERLKDVPVIMITSRTGERHKERAMELGASSYFGKPYNEVELLAEIRSFTG
ncbi:MAG: response regulator, partial [Gammaproteobacteria bacterium]|nr:response regulator [Gammaproteobacteria bacterium]